MLTRKTYFIEKTWECLKCNNVFKAEGEFSVDNEDFYPTVVKNGNPFCTHCGSMETEVA